MTATKEEKPKPVFSCYCSQTCEAGVWWLTRAPMAECFHDDAKCECKCHPFAVENDASFQRWQQETGRRRLWFARL